MTFVPEVAGALKARHDGSFTGDGRGMEIVPDVVGALKARSYKGINNEELQTGQAIVQEFAPTVTSKWAKGTGGPSGSETGNLVLDNAQAFNWQSGGDARGLDLTDETSALTCQQTPAVFGMLGASGAEGASEEEQPAITSSHGQPGNVAVPEEMVDFGRTSDRIRINAESAATLQAGGGGAGAKTGLYMVPQAFDEMNFSTSDTHHVLRAGTQQSTGALSSYGVRRLTPVECERLQAFPDGWTEPTGSDSARYKAMGNAVTVNTVRWILGRIIAVEESRDG